MITSLLPLFSHKDEWNGRQLPDVSRVRGIVCRPITADRENDSLTGKVAHIWSTHPLQLRQLVSNSVDKKTLGEVWLCENTGKTEIAVSLMWLLRRGH